MVLREERSTAIDALDDSDDTLDEEGEEPWEEPTHVTRKRARGRRGGKKVAARPVRPARKVGAYAEFEGLCLLCTQPGHCAADCTTGPVCLRCGETGHMARECSLPRPPRPPSPPDGDEPARKRAFDGGRNRQLGESAGGFRARAPEPRQAAVEQRAPHREPVQRRAAAAPRTTVEPRRVETPPLRVEDAPRRAATMQLGVEAGRRAVAPQRTNLEAAFVRRDVPVVGVARAVAPAPVRGGHAAPRRDDRAMAPILPSARPADEVARPRRGADEQVAPLSLRATAEGGELARRPARAACVIPRTPEMDDAEVALSKALLAVIVGVRREVTTEEVAMALEDAHGLAPGSYSVHCHRPEDFLLYFATREARDRALDPRRRREHSLRRGQAARVTRRTPTQGTPQTCLPGSGLSGAHHG